MLPHNVVRRKRSILSRSRPDAKQDYISCLPGDVIDQILSCLPIKEAVRTSVLSTKWTNKWKTLPNLLFDRNCVSIAASQDPSVINNKFSRMVDQVLLLHHGSIDKFQICDYKHELVGVDPEVDIRRWILHLITRSIKELALVLPREQHYTIPSCLFNCQSLCCLELRYCLFKPPTKFQGFKNLKSLNLKNLTITQDALENLISNSPLLENLTLYNLDGVKQINIRGPNLKVFNLFANFEDISFDNTFKISKLMVTLKDWHIQGKCSGNLLWFFDHLHHIQSLEIYRYFLKYLVSGVVVPVKLPIPCINLTSLRLGVNFDDRKEISAALCLLKSSPNLQNLQIIVPPGLTGLLTPGAGWENIFSDPTMLFQVRHVNIFRMSGFKSELEFIRFLLLYSPMLETMVIETKIVKPEVLIEIIGFKRASTQVEVNYKVSRIFEFTQTTYAI